MDSTDDRNESIYQRHLEGTSYYDLSVEFGLNYDTVRQIVFQWRRIDRHRTEAARRALRSDVTTAHVEHNWPEPSIMSRMHQSDYALAKNHAPVLCLDSLEPFSIKRVFYTVFRWAGDSPSFARRIEFQSGEDLAIEYAISWDFDIGHSYELEHIWVFLDPKGGTTRIEATAHGSIQRCQLGDEPKLFVEAGKHGMAATEDGLLKRSTQTHLCTKWAGIRGAFVPQRFQADWLSPSVSEWLDTEGHLQAKAFQPAFIWNERQFSLGSADLVPWDDSTVSWLLESSRQAIQSASGSPWRLRRVARTTDTDLDLATIDTIELRASEIDNTWLNSKSSWVRSGTELMILAEGKEHFERVLSAVTFAYRMGLQNALTLWLDDDALNSMRPLLEKCYEVRLGFIGPRSEALTANESLPLHSGFFWIREHSEAPDATVVGHPNSAVFEWI